VDIDDRPGMANQRGRLSDWETDTMIGKGHQGALVTLDERKSKLRLAFPKAMGMLDVTIPQVLEAVHKLNSRPRKCLGFKTPYEMFYELSGMDAEKLVGYAFIT